MKTRKATDEELAKYREMTAPLYDAMRANVYGGNYSSATQAVLSQKIDAILAEMNAKVMPSGLRIIVSK